MCARPIDLKGNDARAAGGDRARRGPCEPSRIGGAEVAQEARDAHNDRRQWPVDHRCEDDWQRRDRDTRPRRQANALHFCNERRNRKGHQRPSESRCGLRTAQQDSRHQNYEQRNKPAGVPDKRPIATRRLGLKAQKRLELTLNIVPETRRTYLNLTLLGDKFRIAVSLLRRKSAFSYRHPAARACIARSHFWKRKALVAVVSTHNGS